MGIFDGIETEGRRGPECPIAIIEQALDKDDRSALARVLADRAIDGTLIYKRLVAAGHKPGKDSVQRHRRGACGCKP